MIYIIVEAYYDHHGKPTVTDPIYLPRNRIPYVLFEKCVGEHFEKRMKYFNIVVTVFNCFLDAKIYKERLTA